VLLAGIFAFHAGWYMLIPFFAVLFTARRGMTPAEVGFVLAAQSFTLLLGSLLGGFLADRFGRKLTMVGGLALRAAGVAFLGLTPTVQSALIAASVAGVGGGLYGPAAKAAIAVIAARGETRADAFSWRGIAASVGTSLGPVAGGVLMHGPMPVLFGASAAVHGVMGVFTWALLPREATELDRQVRAPWRDLLADRPYMAFSAVTALAWALFSQLALAVPLYASRMLGLAGRIGLLWTASSLAVILFQAPITRYVISRMQPMRAMAAGAALLGAGLGLVGLAHSFTALLGAVLVFVLGEMLLMPTVDTTVSQMAPAAAVGSYFGVASFAWGLGEGVGNLAGGELMGFALSSGRLGLPWALYAGTGLVVGGLYWALARVRKPATQPPEAKPLVFRPGLPTPEEDSLRNE
jgi:MFS family permease